MVGGGPVVSAMMILRIISYHHMPRICCRVAADNAYELLGGVLHRQLDDFLCFKTIEKNRDDRSGNTYLVGRVRFSDTTFFSVNL